LSPKAGNEAAAGHEDIADGRRHAQQTPDHRKIRWLDGQEVHPDWLDRDRGGMEVGRSIGKAIAEHVNGHQD